MPHRTGVSHSFAALLAMISASYLKDILQRVVSTRDLVAYANEIAGQLVQQVGVTPTPDLLATVGSAGIISVLVFVWGWAYHHKVIS